MSLVAAAGECEGDDEAMSGPIRHYGPMCVLPRRSPGVLLSPLGDHGIVYDASTGTRHRLNWTAAAVLEACDGVTTLDEFVDEVARRSLIAPEDFRREVEVVLMQFVELDLVRSVDGSEDDGDGAEGVGVRDEDAWAAGMDSEASRAGGSGIEGEPVFELHAGGVRSPDGEILVLPAPSGAGKSTLVAAFVASGWDYLGDEVIGIDSAGMAVGFPGRLSLGSTSAAVVGLSGEDRLLVEPTDLHVGVEVLSGSVGPVGWIVLPRFAVGMEPELLRLGPDEAFDELLVNTIDLGGGGQLGLDLLTGLAESTPIFRLVHGDAIDAVEALVAAIGGRERSEA